MAPSYQHGLPFPKMDPQSAHLKLPDVSSQDGRDHDPPIHTSGLKADRSVWGLPGADKRAKPRTGRNRKGTGPTLSNNLTNSRDAIFSPKDLFGRCNGRQSHPARTEGECVRVPERNCGERARASGGKGTLSSSVCTSNDGQSRAAHRPEAGASTPPRASALCACSSSSRRRSSATFALAPAASLCIISNQSTAMATVYYFCCNLPQEGPSRIVLLNFLVCGPQQCGV